MISASKQQKQKEHQNGKPTGVRRWDEFKYICSKRDY